MISSEENKNKERGSSQPLGKPQLYYSQIFPLHGGLSLFCYVWRDLRIKKEMRVCLKRRVVILRRLIQCISAFKKVVRPASCPILPSFS
jgi:hypothetical protein